MGCIDNPLIDKAILKDDTKNNKNLSSTWIDVEKAFDSVSHVWLIEVLKMQKINEKLVAFVENVMKSWTISLELRTSAGNQEISPLIKKARYTPRWRILSWALCSLPQSNRAVRQRKWRVQPFTCKEHKDNALSYRGRPEATILKNRLEGMWTDIGLDWGIRKCAATTSREENSRILEIYPFKAVAKYQYQENITIIKSSVSYRMSTN